MAKIVVRENFGALRFSFQIHSPFQDWLQLNILDCPKEKGVACFYPIDFIVGLSKSISSMEVNPIVFFSMLRNLLILFRCLLAKYTELCFSDLTEMLYNLHCRCSLPLRFFSRSWMDAFKIYLGRTISKVAKGISFRTDVLISCLN